MKDNQAKYPQLRFKGFTDPWEERKLSCISERVTRKNKNNESTLPLTISAQDGLVDQNDFFNKQVASRDVTGYFLVKNGEFAYNKSYSNGYPWGAIKRLDKYDMGVLSTLYIVFRPTKINSQFLVSYYDTTRWYREVSKNAAEGARNHGLLNIAPTDFFNTLLVVPKIVDEQQKIGSFFKQLDDTIALHQRKLAKLKELKQGYLQKLFPENGSKFPQLRFAGFADAWEQRKLGDIVVFLNGRAYKQAELLDSGKYPVLRVGNFNTNDKWYYSDLELPAKNYADKGDLLYTWATAFGPHIWKGPKVIYHYHIWKVETTSDISKNFAVHLLDADQAQMTNSLNGSTMVHITKGTMENKIVTIPGISEQRNMARLLDQLDCTIALHQRKLEKLQELKKGYLQKMFC